MDAAWLSLEELFGAFHTILISNSVLPHFYQLTELLVPLLGPAVWESCHFGKLSSIRMSGSDVIAVTL